MTTGEIQGGEGDVQCGRDPLRRVIMTVLAIYLAPVAVVVLIIGGLGMLCCAVASLFEHEVMAQRGALRRDRTARILSVPHLHGVVRSRSHGP
ncbi:hypothetical protein AB1L88_25590 [Tautonia sp. JC769]|uniref:hypothetical protein n=1 Tax=Tautonia sp. JC769 TaxID=3232135 RepID=UPI003458D73D